MDKTTKKNTPAYASTLWDELGGKELEELFEKRPEYAEMYDWSELDGGNWVEILSTQPWLADKCDWSTLNEYLWSSLLKKQPQFADKCDWSKLGSEAWSSLLRSRPQFADKCDKWAYMGVSAMMALLEKQPQFFDKCPWWWLNDTDWKKLIKIWPQFAGKRDWTKLDGWDWATLLSNRLRFANKCDWTKLDGADWALLLRARPQFADKCGKWAEMSGQNWASLLEKQPQFADKCDKWAEMSGQNWAWLLQEQPQFADKCDWGKLDGWDWERLLEKQPKFAGKCDWKKLDGGNWGGLLAKQPKFASKCKKWSEIPGNCWAFLLKMQPQFADKCDKWGELSDWDWRFLLDERPEFADKCDWSKVVGTNWRYLYINHPQFAISRRKWLDETRSKGSGAEVALTKRENTEPAPRLEEIRRLLSEDPEKAFEAIWRMGCQPESAENPFGPRERLVADAICDRSLAKTTRARLLRRVGNDCELNGLPFAKASDVPLGFLDTTAGRKWYCAHGGAGCEVVRCSDLSFFKNMVRKEDSDEVDVDKAKIVPKVRRAINADSPAQLMMQLSVLGRQVDARLLAIILTLRKTKILEWLLENDKKTKECLDDRRMLFYVCAHWPYQDATDWLEKAEAKQPGIIKSCVDALGRNLLWYTQYNRRHGRAEETLLNHGCDPDAETAWGLSWRDMKANNLGK